MVIATVELQAFAFTYLGNGKVRVDLSPKPPEGFTLPMGIPVSIEVPEGSEPAPYEIITVQYIRNPNEE